MASSPASDPGRTGKPRSSFEVQESSGDLESALNSVIPNRSLGRSYTLGPVGQELDLS